MIRVQNVTKVFEAKDGPFTALKNVSFEVKRGEIYGVIGFSGAGKSTLVRCLNFLEKPSSGDIFIEGRSLKDQSAIDLRKERHRIGMIFQHFNLFQSRTVAGNIAYPLKLAKWPKEKISERVKELLAFVGLEDKAKHYPDQLSGGQKQRVGIARALATSPSILLCDEATSALDPQTTDSILNLLKRINAEYGITIVMITHEMGVIREICDKVAVMENGEIVEEGSVFDIFSNPQTRTTKNFVKSVMNDQLPASVLDKLNDSKEGRICRLIFKGDSTGTPILSETAKKFDAHINVLFGQITELQGKPFGNLIVQIIGSKKETEEILDYWKNRLFVSEVEKRAS
ncbi:methionine ABC transporter ATP-binding protein [Rossellomorea aquimaris]|jgi:D-methionine transport system ATP-binding protein|uniref:Methionine ABC transporter ATP-binding protein n=1 Tax=Rossellomorea aquimaris TaxID=189382 RepID=A0A5D4UIS5_9BACI|nr:methionine ABC transporter ATP-binding protein [Rossellomorea aquimaris]TYS75667.1 methionine ABC transporter ATP-binding protein [Rossellomorea aquimaris]TYS87236.1 methionine ABC transporter ATP-binding protein [Rossellomorea aquimaris]